MDHININFDKKNVSGYPLKVNEIEFQGQIVKVTGISKDIGKLSLSLADDVFLKNKFSIDNEILISWDKKRENLLQ